MQDDNADLPQLISCSSSLIIAEEDISATQNNNGKDAACENWVITGVIKPIQSCKAAALFSSLPGCFTLQL